MFLKKLITSLLTIQFLVFIPLFLVKKKHINYILLALLITYFFSTTLGSNLIIYQLEKDYLNQYFFYKTLFESPENIIKLYQKVDKIVILAGGVNENFELAEESLQRTITALLIYKNLQKFYNKSTQIIILGGNLEDSKTPTSTAIKLLLTNIIDYSNVKITEDKLSLDTYQNIENLKKILINNKNEKILIISSAFHLKRVKLIIDNTFENQETKDSFLLVACNFKYKYKLTIYDFLPSTENLKNSNIALREIFGIIYYSIYYKIKKMDQKTKN